MKPVAKHLQAAMIAGVWLLFTNASFAQSTTRTRLNVAPSPSAIGQTVRLSAELDLVGSGVVTGNMEFRDGGTTLGSAALSTTGASMTALGAGGAHACALTAGSGVRCWGFNGHGQLGDGTQTARSTFVDVSGLTYGVAAIATGYFHNCALLFDRTVKCWGSNNHGGVGDGSTTDRLAPVGVPNLSNVVSLAAGNEHTCAVLATGEVWCWGYNDYGQLGDGTIANQTVPVQVQGITNAVAVAAGHHHTCALLSGGEVKCWGSNLFGEIGDGSNQGSRTPSAVVGLSSGVLMISAGESSTCALLMGGGVKCWGWNAYGQLGDGTTVDRFTPVDVVGLTSGGAVSIDAGYYGVCALTTEVVVTSSIKCWGDNSTGQLGDGTATQRNAPVRVLGLTQKPVAVAMGYSFTCTLSVDRRARCWGLNDIGQLGDGTTVSRLKSGGAVVGLSTTVRARAAFETNSLSRGFHNLEAAYAGDALNLSSTGRRGHSVR